MLGQLANWLQGGVCETQVLSRRTRKENWQHFSNWVHDETTSALPVLPSRGCQRQSTAPTPSQAGNDPAVDIISQSDEASQTEQCSTHQAEHCSASLEEQCSVEQVEEISPSQDDPGSSTDNDVPELPTHIWKFPTTATTTTMHAQLMPRLTLLDTPHDYTRRYLSHTRAWQLEQVVRGYHDGHKECIDPRIRFQNLDIISSGFITGHSEFEAEQEGAAFLHLVKWGTFTSSVLQRPHSPTRRAPVQQTETPKSKNSSFFSWLAAFSTDRGSIAARR